MSDESIFAAALAIPSPDQRAAYLREACNGNPALRKEVEALLAAHASGNPLDEPPGNFAATGLYEATADDPPTAVVGDYVGPYRLMEQIGEGGFGLVFVAEQHEPIRRKVALKILKPGMDTRQVVARFEAERQALALMNHPNIAKVFDAGSTTAGRPYFVMELVHGVPITEYCDQQKLSPRDRLNLFAQVCQAVQHAHQKGVIHRDLKPSNVLVAPHDGVPVVKVIDFGIAKALGQSLTQKTVYTQFAQMIGTPLYMSPEQAEVNQLDVDTRSDIYSLGVILYELLTGTTPFDSQRFHTAAWDEIRRIIREEDPPKPSTRLTSLGDTLKSISSHRGTEPSRLTGMVRGELDWIVMKCLEKERTRRYDSAAGLHKDVQRFLDGDSVEACPPTLGYRLSKTYGKHRTAILTAGSFAVVLLVATAVSLAFGISSRQAEARARAQEHAASSSAKQARQSEVAARQALDQEKAARKRLEEVQYAQSMQLAYQNWQDNNISASIKLLDESRPEFRDWEWQYLNRLCHPELLTFTADKNTEDLRSSQDAKQIATTHGNNTITLWNTQTGAVIHELMHDKALAMRPQFNHRGSRIVTLQRDNFRADSSYDINVWDTKTGKRLLSFHDPAVQVAFCAYSSDDSRIVASNRDGTANFWDANSGEKLSTLQLSEADVPIQSIAFSPDDSRMITNVWRPGAANVTVWDVQSGKKLISLAGSVFGTFSPDGNRIVTKTENDEVVVWNAKTGTEVVRLNVLVEGLDMSSPSFSPDGNRILTRSRGSITLWDAHTGKKQKTIKVNPLVSHHANFTQDGDKILIGGRYGIAQILDAECSQESSVILKHPEQEDVAVSADGRRIVTGSFDGTMKIWDAVSATESLTINVDTTLADGSGYMSSVAISSDADAIVTVVGNMQRRHTAPDNMTNKVTLWNAATGDKVSQIAVPGIVNDCLFSPDSRKLIVWGCDWSGKLSLSNGWVQVWDTTTWTKLTTFGQHTGMVFSGSFSADGKRVVTTGNAFDRTARVWDVDTGTELVTLNQHRSLRERFAVWDACFSPDGKRVLSSTDGEAIIWDAESGEEILSLDGLTGQIVSVAYSPNGRRIITLGSDELKIWDAHNGHELLKLKNDQFSRSARFSPDGTRIYVGGENGVYVYDARSVEPTIAKTP